MWCINTEVLGSCILWIMSMVSFIMVIVLVIMLIQLNKELQRIDSNLYGPLYWWDKKRKDNSRIDTLFNFHKLHEEDIAKLKNVKKKVRR